MQMTVNLDTAKFTQAFNLLHQKTSNPAPALHRAVAFVIRDAKARTPVTSQSRIDQELSVMGIPVISKKGARAGLPLKNGKKTYEFAPNGLGIAVMLARLKRYSSYNVLTDMKYAIDRASFSPGMGRAGFWARLELRAQAMVKGRHSSTGFFKISWNALLAKIAPYVDVKYQGAVMTWAGQGGAVAPDLGEFTPARPGEPKAICVVYNWLGSDDRYPTISAIRNMAAHKILDPVLEEAIQSEYEKQMMVAFNRNLIDGAALVRAQGVELTMANT